MRVSGSGRHFNALMAGTAVLLALGTQAFAQTAPASEEAAAQDGIIVRGNKVKATLDTITVTASKGEEAAIDQLAGVSVVSAEDLERIQAGLPSEIFRAVPGVMTAPLGNDPGTIMNIRGLQDFGRVAVTVDGARQNFSRNSHAGNGTFYLEPEILKSATVIRGPVANAYGSGAIGGVISFETIDPVDFLEPGETWALSEKFGIDFNSEGYVTSTTGALQVNDQLGVLGNFVYRNDGDYTTGNGVVLGDTAQELENGLLKAVINPAEFHEIELSGILFNDDYDASRSAGLSSATTEAVETQNQAATARWTYSNPDDRLFDFQGTAYWNDTDTSMVKTGPTNSGSTGNIGDRREFDVETYGFDLHNASRVAALGFENTFTYGGDYFHDDADSWSDLTTSSPPKSTASATGSGVREAYGAFLEWKGERGDWLELIAAARYDGFNLEGEDASGDPVSLDGGRLSPRATIGVTPLTGFQLYGTYAEGYRAPSITETFVGGSHQNDFSWIPNPDLDPEIARTFEIGTNLKYDGVFSEVDQLRAKVAVFHTEVDDYIDIVSLGGGISQYQNIDGATIEGIEAELNYDFGAGFLGLAGALIDAENDDGGHLNNAPQNKFSATVGMRAFEERLTYGMQWISIGEGWHNAVETEVPAYNLVNVFANFQVSKNVRVDFAIENLLDEDYTNAQSGYFGLSPSYQPVLVEDGKGQTIKLAITSRIGG